MVEAAPTANERAVMEAALQGVSPLSEDDLQCLRPHARRVHLPKGASLLKAGERASVVAFVLGGGLREYYLLEDGTERTKGFNMPGEFAGSLSDLLSGEPSRVWVTAEAPTDLICTPWAVYHRLTLDAPAWSRYARRIAEGLYLIKVEREFELLTMDAAQRHARALRRWPALESVFSQRDIASYIGVTPVHLSRLRTGATPAREASEQERRKG